MQQKDEEAVSGMLLLLVGNWYVGFTRLCWGDDAEWTVLRRCQLGKLKGQCTHKNSFGFNLEPINVGTWIDMDP